MLEEKKCLICGGSNFKRFAKGRRGDCVASCAQCGFVFTRPRPSEEELLAKYGGEYYSHWVSPAQRRARENLWLRRLAVVRRYAPSGKLLDVGSGEGLFLSVASMAGYDAGGVEISSWGADYARRTYGVKVFNGQLEKAGFIEGEFDAITMWHTLEHLIDPRAALEFARRILRKGGRLFVAVPNVNDLPGRFFYSMMTGRTAKLYTPDAKEPHLWHFSPESLSSAIVSSGFSIVSSGIDYAQVDPYWRAIEYAAAAVSTVTGLDWQLNNLVVASK